MAAGVSTLLAHFWILLLACAALFVIGIVLTIIGRSMRREAEWKMAEWRHAEMLDAIRGIPDESHRYQKRP
jgi:ABC-type arginine transport system permease subunit